MSLSQCALTSGIDLDCRDSQGSIEYVYIGNGGAGAITFTTTVVTGECPNLVNSIEVGGNPVTWYKFEVPKQTSSYTETVNASTENGTIYYQQDVALVFNKLQCDTRNQMLLLGQNTKTLIVVKDGNGNFWTAGLTRGCELTAGSYGTGTSYGDRNGYVLTLTGLEPDPMYAVDPAVVGE